MDTFDDSIFFIFFMGPSTGGGGVVYSPSLRFDDARNSQYLAIGFP